MGLSYPFSVFSLTKMINNYFLKPRLIGLGSFSEKMFIDPVDIGKLMILKKDHICGRDNQKPEIIMSNYVRKGGEDNLD